MMEAHDCNSREDLGVGCINARCPLHRAMRSLAANLAIGAALCLSFVLGQMRGGRDLFYSSMWQPGCGKEAP